MTPEPLEQLARGAAEILPAGELERKLALGRPLRVKLGIDPTAPDIHLGHTVVLRKLRDFQDAGHVVVLIIGDFTARVGDPSGRSELRPMLTVEEIEANARTYQEQAFKVIDDDPARLELRRNSEWLDMDMGSLLGLVRTTTVGQLMARDDFAKRTARGEPVSVLELLYPLMQGYDSVAVRADIELGGTDQTFNLLLGRDIQRHYGQPEQAVLTMPLLLGLDGAEKMSKSLGNHIGVTDPPGEIYGRTMSIPDSSLAQWHRLLLGRELAGGADPLAAKRALAHELTARYHGAGAAEHAARRVGCGDRRPGRPERDPRDRLLGQRRPDPPSRADRAGLRNLALGGSSPDLPGRGVDRRAPGRGDGREPGGARRARAARRAPALRAPAPPADAAAQIRYSPLSAPAGASAPATRAVPGAPRLGGAAVFENSTACAPRPASADLVCVQVRPAAGNGRGTSQESAVPLSWSGAHVYRPRHTMTDSLHGEFDPGSGRTLAACLIHASGATNQASAWGKAANG